MDFFHVFNRGVDKRKTFLHASDYLRFLQNLHIYNATEPYPHNAWTIAERLKAPSSNRLVTIHAYCLMPNHYHLLLTPVRENGVSLFMQKVNMGYSKYFNERYERSGALWQGKYKSVAIVNDAQFLYLPYYIHLNALDKTMPKWRRGLVKDTERALATLENYRWSSHAAFLHKHDQSKTLVAQSFFVQGLSQKEYTGQIKKIISTPDIAELSSRHEWQ
jgi:putative transposase